MFESTATIDSIMVETSINPRIHETCNSSEYSACAEEMITLSG